MKQIIKCGTLFTGQDDKTQKDMALYLEDNKIVKVCPLAGADTEGWAVVDLTGKFVMPGLIDAHMHLSANGNPGNKFTTIGDSAITTALNAKTELLAGFTSIRDEGGRGFADVAVRNAVNEGRLDGPRMTVSGVCIGSTGGHADSHLSMFATPSEEDAFIINSPDEGRAAVRKVFKYGADQVKIMATGGVMSFGDDPRASDLTYEEMKAICDIANEHGRLSSAHAHGANGIKYAIRAGITSIEHGMMMDDECVDLFCEYGTYLIPTIIAAQNIITYGRGKMDDWAVDKAELVLAGHKANLAKCRARGVKIGFGTDCGTTFNYHGKQGLEFKLMVDYGFTPAYTLQAATRINAELLRKADTLGTLEAGKLADVVAFDESPLENIEIMQKVAFVMKDGKIYKQ